MSAPVQGLIRIRLLKAGRVLRAWEIRAESATIGSAKGCQLRVQGDPGIQERHATLYVEDGQINLVPESGASVTLNGEEADFALPGPSDVIGIGKLRLGVEWVPPEPEPAAEEEDDWDDVTEEVTAPNITPPPPPPRAAELGRYADKPLPEPIAEEPEPEPEPEPELDPLAAMVDGVAPAGATEPEPPPDDDWDDDEDDDEESFVEPFDLAQMLLTRKPTGDGRRAGYATALLVRVIDGRVAETVNVAAGQDYASADDTLRCRMDGEDIRLTLGDGYTGWVRHGDQQIDVVEPLSVLLSAGDGAVLAGRGARWKVDVIRPPRAPWTTGVSIGMLAVLLVLSGVSAAGLAAAAGVLVRLIPDDEILIEEDPDEMFVTLEMQRDKPPPQPVPKTAMAIAEQAPTVTREEVAEIEPPEPSTVDSLLTQLTKGLGDKQDLEKALSNVDAVPGSTGGTSAFDLSGALASLDGDEVTYARESAAGGINTTGTDGIDSALSRLQGGGGSGEVRGKVTNLRSQMKVQGSLSREDVSRVISENMPQIQACYERALINNPALGGKIGFEWTVKTDGGVRNVRVATSTLASPKVAECISGVIKGMKFPQPQGGEVVVAFPFLFRASSL